MNQTLMVAYKPMGDIRVGLHLDQTQKYQTLIIYKRENPDNQDSKALTVPDHSIRQNKSLSVYIAANTVVSGLFPDTSFGRHQFIFVVSVTTKPYLFFVPIPKQTISTLAQSEA